MSESSFCINNNNNYFNENNEFDESSINENFLNENNLKIILPINFIKPRINRNSQFTFLNDIMKINKENIFIKCILKREKRGIFNKYIYQLFSENEEEPIFIAFNDSNLISTKFNIIETITGNKIGIIESNFSSLYYQIIGSDCNFSIEYDENFLGRNGCRFFKIFINEKIIYLSKPPLIINNDFFHDFHELDIIPSIKNFIIVPENNLNEENLIFAKTNLNEFILKIKSPFSIFHAFSIALTSFHTGLFHR